MGLINEVLFVGALLLFGALLLSAVSQRAGVPVLLVFLAVGLFATEIPGAPPNPIDTTTAALIGNLALAVILLDGGLRTRVATFRLVAAPALTLATVGVLLSAAVVGAFAILLLGLDWRYGLLLGAIVGSTDAAAVFALLRSGGTRLNERVGATLEVESGANDPMAVFLTLACIELINSPDASWTSLLAMFATQLGIGLAGGWLLGRVLASIVGRVRLGEGLLALLIQSGGLLIFAATSLAHGSGFLAIYLAGIIVGRDEARVNEDVLRASDGLAWLAQAGMFLILGIFTDVKDLLVVAPIALLIACALIFVARPFAVAVCLLPFRYPPRENAFIGWMGLRGAVPIVLGLFPLLAGVPGAPLLFHVAFFSVLLSLTLQGGTLRLAARLARVTVREVSPVLAVAPVEACAQPRELVQLRVLPGASIVERPLDELAWPAGVRFAEMLRNGAVSTAATLQPGDVVALLSPKESVVELEALFAPAGAAAEWSLGADVTLGDLRDYYGLEIPAHATPVQSLGEFMRAQLNQRPASGDAVAVGALVLTVRNASGGAISRVGLRVLSPARPVR